MAGLGTSGSAAVTGKITPFQTTKTIAPAQKGSGGLLSRLASGIIAAPKYFAENDIVDPIKETAAQVTGNKVAAANAQQTSNQNLGLGKSGTNIGNATKKLVGNTADLASTLLIPEAKAGLGARVVQGAKIGAVGGGGSALANNQNVLKGAVTGAATGGALNGVLGSLFRGKTGASANATDDAVSKPSVIANAKQSLNNHAQQIEAGAGGFNAGAKLPGAAPSGISLSESQKLSGLADKYKIPAGSPVTRLRYIQNQLTSAGSGLSDKLEQNNIPLSDDDKQAIMNEFHNKVNEQPNAQALQPHAAAASKHFLGTDTQPISIGGQELDSATAASLGIKSPSTSQVTDLKGLNGYKQKLDSLINYSRNSATPDPAAEQAHTIMRQTLSDQLNKYAPDVADANTKFSELKQLESPTLQENNKLQAGGGGLYNRLLNNSVVKGTEAKVGRGVQRLTGGVTPNVSTPSSVLSKLSGKATAPVSENTSEEVMNGVDKLTPTKIPVKQISTTYKGNPVAQNISKLFINPQNGEGIAALHDLVNKGYKITQNEGRTSPLAVTNATKPVLQNSHLIKGERTSIPFKAAGPPVVSKQQIEQVVKHVMSSPLSSLGETATEETRTADLAHLLGVPMDALHTLVDSLGSRIPTSAALGGAEATQNGHKATAAEIQKFDNLTQGERDANDSINSDIDQRAQASSADSGSTSSVSYGLQDLENDINRDPKNAATYEAFYDKVTAANKADTSDTNLNATQQKEVTSGEAAINLLQNYGNQIDSLTKGANGNVATGTLSTLIGKYSPVASSADRNAASLETQKRDVAIQLATAISGGNKPTTTSIQQIENGLPSVNDPPTTRQAKITNLVERLNTTLKVYATPVNQLVGDINQ